jgi:hypothetical protein
MLIFVSCLYSKRANGILYSEFVKQKLYPIQSIVDQSRQAHILSILDTENIAESTATTVQKYHKPKNWYRRIED